MNARKPPAPIWCDPVSGLTVWITRDLVEFTMNDGWSGRLSASEAVAAATGFAEAVAEAQAWADRDIATGSYSNTDIGGSRTTSRERERMTTYIAGPMSGLPEFNFPKFRAVAAELRSRGVDVRCPTDNDAGSTGKPWEFYMRLAIKQLIECDEIVLLPGWRNSRGARLERHIANELGMTISRWDDDLMTVKEAWEE